MSPARALLLSKGIPLTIPSRAVVGFLMVYIVFPYSIRISQRVHRATNRFKFCDLRGVRLRV